MVNGCKRRGSPSSGGTNYCPKVMVNEHREQLPDFSTENAAGEVTATRLTPWLSAWTTSPSQVWDISEILVRSSCLPSSTVQFPPTTSGLRLPHPQKSRMDTTEPLRSHTLGSPHPYKHWRKRGFWRLFMACIYEQPHRVTDHAVTNNEFLLRNTENQQLSISSGVLWCFLTSKEAANTSGSFLTWREHQPQPCTVHALAPAHRLPAPAHAAWGSRPLPCRTGTARLCVLWRGLPFLSSSACNINWLIFV